MHWLLKFYLRGTKEFHVILLVGCPKKTMFICELKRFIILSIRRLIGSLLLLKVILMAEC